MIGSISREVFEECANYEVYLEEEPIAKFLSAYSALVVNCIFCTASTKLKLLSN